MGKHKTKPNQKIDESTGEGEDLVNSARVNVLYLEELMEDSKRAPSHLLQKSIDECRRIWRKKQTYLAATRSGINALVRVCMATHMLLIGSRYAGWSCPAALGRKKHLALDAFKTQAGTLCEFLKVFETPIAEKDRAARDIIPAMIDLWGAFPWDSATVQSFNALFSVLERFHTCHDHQIKSNQVDDTGEYGWCVQGDIELFDAHEDYEDYCL